MKGGEGMSWKEIFEFSKTIVEKFSYHDWKILVSAVEFAFSEKGREHERQLTLSPEDVEKAIRSLFGQIPD